jgi:hypothetical protein
VLKSRRTTVRGSMSRRRYISSPIYVYSVEIFFEKKIK